jgi:hypothetical protein
MATDILLTLTRVLRRLNDLNQPIGEIASIYIGWNLQYNRKLNQKPYYNVNVNVTLLMFSDKENPLKVSKEYF